AAPPPAAMPTSKPFSSTSPRFGRMPGFVPALNSVSVSLRFRERPDRDALEARGVGAPAPQRDASGSRQALVVSREQPFAVDRYREALVLDADLQRVPGIGGDLRVGPDDLRDLAVGDAVE